eukprot:CAMPEP_0184491768 /NCGR_PEP_ID=MMETSP0113_2-20130426/21330_1 /TAXON_ID=91329 /ORGANISM="Norrisiella sphaerica, Strain BC52" /LENGTH=227 /DNA_ID=CAMNT_0026876277 /DNA_START=18 /DNA_END=701 /DNA_ORIENTATION=-
MPTVTIATSAKWKTEEKESIICHLTDLIALSAKVPQEYIHIHISDSQVMSFGGLASKPCAQISIMTVHNQLETKTRESIAIGITACLKGHSLNPERVQVVFPEMALSQIAIKGELLGQPGPGHNKSARKEAKKGVRAEEELNEDGQEHFGDQIKKMESSPFVVMIVVLAIGVISQRVLHLPQEVTFLASFGTLLVGLMVIGIMKRSREEAKKLRTATKLSKGAKKEQ